MPRKKSANDLFEQYKRIRSAAGEGSPREQRAKNAYRTYDRNITSSKSYRRAAAKYRDDMSDAEFDRLESKTDGRQYSQRTYMGMSVG